MNTLPSWGIAEVSSGKKSDLDDNSQSVGEHGGCHLKLGEVLERPCLCTSTLGSSSYHVLYF